MTHWLAAAGVARLRLRANPAADATWHEIAAVLSISADTAAYCP